MSNIITKQYHSVAMKGDNTQIVTDLTTTAHDAIVDFCYYNQLKYAVRMGIPNDKIISMEEFRTNRRLCERHWNFAQNNLVTSSLEVVVVDTAWTVS